MTPADTSVVDCAKRGPGRPRNPELDRAVLEAAADLLAEDGYDRLTIEAVAARAGVGKTTVYRRWPSKSALIVDALITLTDHADVPETGDISTDLRAWARSMVQSMTTGRKASMMSGLSAELPRNPELAHAFRTSFLGPRRALLRGRLERAVAAGQLRAELDLDLVADALSGSMCMRLLFTGYPVTTKLADKLVDLLLNGAATRSHDRKGP